MIRVCIKCKHVFGCQWLDGRKWKCKGCRNSARCAFRMMPYPPSAEMTGGICDWCFENFVIPKYHKFLPEGERDA